MAEAPHISIVIAARNAARFLPATLRSILDQTFTDFEVILVDDDSDDGSAEIVDEVAATDPRVRLIRLDRNIGRSAARNAGLDEARGTWVCPMDADDLWFRGRLREFVLASEQFPAVESFTDDLIEFSVQPDGHVRLGHRHASRVSWRVGRNHPLPLAPWFRDRECHMRAFIRRDLLDRHRIRFPEDLSSGEDLAFYIQVAFTTDTPAPVRVAQPNYYYRVGESVRAANMAESRVRLTRHAVEATGNPDLARLVEDTLPTKVFMASRGDRKYREAGRSGERDPGSDEVELEMDAVRGWLQIGRNRVVRALGEAADHHLRPAIVADIERQLAVTTPSARPAPSSTSDVFSV